MFCPKCGQSEQEPETFCRKCGTFLPDLSKPSKRTSPPSEHIKANAVLSAMTIFTSFTLAALLYYFIAFRPDTPVLIYVTAAFLLAIGGWHIQTLIRTLKLRNQLKSWGRLTEPKQEPVGSPQAALNEADLSNVVPASIVEHTTRNLTER